MKNKIQIGADYVTTQMFFNNDHFYNYVKRCGEHNVKVPIMPGLKPLTNQNQLTMIPRFFNVEVPVDLYDEMMKAKTPEACDIVGTEWLLHQCRDLLKNKVPVLHFYTLSKPNVIYNVLKQLF